MNMASLLRLIKDTIMVCLELLKIPILKENLKIIISNIIRIIIILKTGIIELIMGKINNNKTINNLIILKDLSNNKIVQIIKIQTVENLIIMVLMRRDKIKIRVIAISIVVLK